MKNILLALTGFATILAQQSEETPPFLTTAHYAPAAQTWVNQYAINQNDNPDILVKEPLLSYDQMQIMLNALYYCIAWVDAEQKAADSFVQAVLTFNEIEQRFPQGMDQLNPVEILSRNLFKECATCVAYKKNAQEQYRAYSYLEPLLLSESLQPAWQALNNNHAQSGQQILAYDVSMSKEHLDKAAHGIARSLAPVQNAQRLMDALATTLHEDDMINTQNRLIGCVQDDVDHAIAYTYDAAHTLQLLQHNSNRWMRMIYSVIFYSYYNALYTAMKTTHIPDNYFFIMVDEHGIMPQENQTTPLPAPLRRS